VHQETINVFQRRRKTRVCEQEVEKKECEWVQDQKLPSSFTYLYLTIPIVGLNIKPYFNVRALIFYVCEGLSHP